MSKNKYGDILLSKRYYITINMYLLKFNTYIFKNKYVYV